MVRGAELGIRLLIGQNFMNMLGPPDTSMLTLSGAHSTTSLIGYYHLSVFGLLHLVHSS